MAKTASLHAWRDDVLTAHTADANHRTESDWCAELAFADRMGWLTTAQHNTALDEIDRRGRVWSAAATAEEEDEAAIPSPATQRVIALAGRTEAAVQKLRVA